MQQQLYGKSITSITQPLDLRAQQAERISQIVKLILWGLIVLAVALSTVLYVLAKNFKNRRVRIIQKLDA